MESEIINVWVDKGNLRRHCKGSRWECHSERSGVWGWWLHLSSLAMAGPRKREWWAAGLERRAGPSRQRHKWLSSTAQQLRPSFKCSAVWNWGPPQGGPFCSSPETPAFLWCLFLECTPVSNLHEGASVPLLATWVSCSVKWGAHEKCGAWHCRDLAYVLGLYSGNGMENGCMQTQVE